MLSITLTARSVELRELIQRNRNALDAALAKYGAENPRLFGSVARGNAQQDSDVDILFSRPAGMELFSIVEMGIELSDILGVTVDVVPDEQLHEHLRPGVLKDVTPL